MTDFFISYTRADRDWAVWVTWVLEEQGYTTVIQDWDFRPGGNFVLDMHRAAAGAERTVAILSPDYLSSRFGAAEWAAAFAKDPTGERGILLPVRVREVELAGLLPQVVYIDLVGLDQEASRAHLLAGVKRERAKPARPPAFPGVSPPFPGSPKNAPTSSLPLDAIPAPGPLPAGSRMPFVHNPGGGLNVRNGIMDDKPSASKKWDVFISHASEDKEAVALPLADLLARAGLKVWIDAQELRIGDSLREKIEYGLANTRFGAVIISGRFLKKSWTRRELNGLMALAKDKKFILPVWHNINEEQVVEVYPILADIFAANTKDGLASVAEQIIKEVELQFPFSSSTGDIGGGEDRTETKTTSPSLPATTTPVQPIPRSVNLPIVSGERQSAKTARESLTNSVPAQSSEQKRSWSRTLIIVVICTLLLVIALIALWPSSPRKQQTRFSGQTQKVLSPPPALPSTSTSIEPPKEQLVNENDANLEKVIAGGGSDHDIKYWLDKGAHFTPRSLIYATATAADDFRYDQYVKIIKKIVKNGVSINYRDEGGTPLSIATGRLKARLMLFLLDHEADPNLPDGEGRSQFIIAFNASVLQGGYVPEIDNPKLFGIWDLLIKKGGNINYQNGNGQTVLMAAADLDRTDWVKFLLKRGAKKGLTDNSGNTAQNYAEKKDTDLATLLAP